MIRGGPYVRCAENTGSDERRPNWQILPIVQAEMEITKRGKGRARWVVTDWSLGGRITNTRNHNPQFPTTDPGQVCFKKMESGD